MNSETPLSGLVNAVLSGDELTPDQQLQAELLGLNDPLKKKKRERVYKKLYKTGRRKVPCKTTLDASVRQSTRLTLLISAAFFVLTVLVCIFVIYPLTKNRIASDMRSDQDNLQYVAIYNSLDNKASYELILREIIEMESQLITAARAEGWTIPEYRRLTKRINGRKGDTEMEHTATLCFIYQQIDGLNWKAYLANRTAESMWDKMCKSEVGACGADQLMPNTFKEVNENNLYKFDNPDIFNVWHNTEAGIRHWIFCSRFLKYNLKREPTVGEIAMCYNGGHNMVLSALQTKTPEKYMPQETIRHGKKVTFYYEHFIKGDYKTMYKDEVIKK